jgi:adenine-specific DNA methylase
MSTEELIKFLEPTMSYVGGLGVIFSFLLKERIRNYFNRDIIRLQQEHKKALEDHKTKLMVELEAAKLNIDLKRSLSIEILNKRLIAYQETIGRLRFYCTLLQLWNKNPSSENVSTIFGGKAGELAWEQVKNNLKNDFFFETSIVENTWKEITRLQQLITEQVSLAKKIENSVLDEFSQSINRLKKELWESISNDYPMADRQKILKI